MPTWHCQCNILQIQLSPKPACESVQFILHCNSATVRKLVVLIRAAPSNLRMPVIFQRGLKYSLRHYYTVIGVAGLFGAASVAVAYRSIKQARSGPSLQEHHAPHS